MTNRPTTHPPRTVPAPAWISTPARRACAGFGLIPTPAPTHTQPIAVTDTELETIAPPGVVLLTGPSGSGKSRLLDALAHTARRQGRRVIGCEDPVPHAGLCVLDTLGVPTPVALDALSAAGLSEPALWTREPHTLSVGERARLGLAHAMAHARRGDLVVCDEFATPLDRAAAQALARTASRWAGRAGVTLLAASAHEDLTAFLDTTAIIRVGSPGARNTHPGAVAAPILVRIEPGSIADHDALAPLHYRAGRPATVVRTLRAVRTTPDGRELLAGVLTVSMPVLNAVWRAQAWPGRYTNANRRDTARRLNTELRCISRVIVDPRSRGLGIASQLVRAYLASPLSPATEAVAAMGAVSPFFRTAGMTEYHLPRPPHDARLSDALEHAGLEPTDLIRPGFTPDPFLDHELTRWAKHAKVRPDRARTPDPLRAIAAHAAGRLATRPRAYAHTRGDHA
tara:strand:- start:243 stop:1607 length:1365 start_codon:yes stop_codon:yes gene_type:complete